MKKLRKHFMVLFLFLLFGVTILSLSSTNGAFASAFGWLQSAPASSAAPQDTGGTTSQQLSTQQDATMNLFVSPINTSGGSILNNTGDNASAADNTAEPGGEYSSPLSNTYSYRIGTEYSTTGTTESPVTVISGTPTDNSGDEDGSDAVRDTGTDTGDSSSTPGTTGTDSGSSNTGGSTGGDSIISSGSHHHRTVSITGVTLDKTELVLLKGGSSTLNATVAPSNTTQGKVITWSSSDDTIVTVDTVGKVTAVKGGTATITAKASNGKTAVCNVTVSIPATAVSLSLSDTPVERGQTLQLTAKLTPEDSTDKVLWATSDNSIAKVDANGNITGVAPGTAYIIAAVGDGSISVSCKITTVVSISRLNLSEENLTIKKGEGHQLTAQVLPEDTTEDKAVAWSSSDPTVATVDDTGKVTAVEGGTAIITAQTGKHSAQCTVTVTVPVTGITLDKTELTLARGTTGVLIPTIAPVDATDKAVDWTSSDETVATVDTDGKITAVSAGTATITGTTHDGGFTANCNVTVIVPVTGVTLDKTVLDLKKGDAAALTATITPADATDKAISWTTSDPKVVTVDASGQVTATGGGNAQITVTTHDGTFAAHCDVTVTVPVTGVTLNKTKLSLMPNATEKLTAKISPSDATDTGITWASSNPSLVAVDQNGNIQILGKTGSAVVTATTHDGGFIASCEVMAMIHVKSISLNHSSLTLTRYNSQTLTANIAPDDATDKEIIWTTSDSSIATVSTSGSVYARGYGSATITATTRDGGYKASCSVTVHGEIQAEISSGYHGYSRNPNVVNEDGSFRLYQEAGLSSLHSANWNSERLEKSLILTFNHPISYTANEPIISLSNVQGYYDREDWAVLTPYLNIYADSTLVYKDEIKTEAYDSEYREYPIKNDYGDCISTQSGSFTQLTITFGGLFHYGNEDVTESPGPGGFSVKVPSGGLRVCGNTIYNVEVL